MSIKNFAAVAALALGSLFISNLPASADVIRKDTDNNIYIYTGSPNAGREIAFAGTQRTRKVTANRCGVVRISSSPTYAAATQISLGGTTSNISALPVATPGKCTSNNGVYSSTGEPAATRYKDSVGTVYIKGLTASSEHTVTYPDLPVTRNVKADNCGLIKLTNSSRQLIGSDTQINVNSNPFTVSSLDTVIAPGCKKISPTQSAFMVPLSQVGYWNLGS